MSRPALRLSRPFLRGIRYASPVTPGSRPSWAQVISAPPNDGWVHCASRGVRRTSVSAMRASRSGFRCFGRARAISPFIASMKVAMVCGAALRFSTSPLPCCSLLSFWARTRSRRPPLPAVLICSPLELEECGP